MNLQILSSLRNRQIHVGIRLQLIILICFVVVVSLIIMAIVAGVSTSHYALGLTGDSLQVVAQLKASQIAQSFSVMYYETYWLSAQEAVQTAMSNYHSGNHSEANWLNATQIFNLTLESAGNFYSISLFDIALNPIYNITNATSSSDDFSLISELYPLGSNKSYPAALSELGGVVSGPYYSAGYLMSITIPVVGNSTVLVQSPSLTGYMTVVMSSEQLQSVVDDETGLKGGGTMILVGGTPYDVGNSSDYTGFRYLLPPTPPARARYGTYNLSDYPDMSEALITPDFSGGNTINARTTLNNHVSVGYAQVSLKLTTWAVGIEEPHDDVYAPMNYVRNVMIGTAFGVAGFFILLALPMAYFAVKPIYRLRTATEQTTLEFHDKPDPAGKGSGPGSESDNNETNGNSDGSELAIEPGTRARGVTDVASGTETGPGLGAETATAATAITTTTTITSSTTNNLSSDMSDPSQQGDNEEKMLENHNGPIYNRHISTNSTSSRFKVPTKVWISKRHIIRDELVELSETYNRMIDELVKQYTHLEDRVRERTQESEAARINAENANERKSLFIANITHELRTPLNGILGMTAVSLTENDTAKIRKSLKVIFKSGELLLNLLNDLLTFSKNQVGNIALDEKEFTISEIMTQLHSLFDSQASEKGIKIEYISTPDFVNSLVLFGDSSRILQVVINLISNALKFAKHNGEVSLSVKCLGEVIIPQRNNSIRMPVVEEVVGGRKESITSDNKRQSWIPPDENNNKRLSWIPDNSAVDSSSFIAGNGGQNDGESRNSIESRDRRKSAGQNSSRDRSRARQMSNISNISKILLFDFEVVDNGPGIADDMQEQIFEPFVQGDQALSRKFGGTGLGLSICRQLAGVLKGDIHLSSRLGSGSTFTLRLPLRVVKNSSGIEVFEPANDLLIPRRNSIDNLSVNSSVDGSSAVATNNNGVMRKTSIGTYGENGLRRHSSIDQDLKLNNVPGDNNEPSQSYFALPKKLLFKRPIPAATAAAAAAASDEDVPKVITDVRVLVADDNLVNLEIIRRMLRLEGIKNITVVNDGEQVVARIGEAIKEGIHYDVVFMDIQMPRMDGLQATKIIRGTLGYPYTIIALTAAADDEHLKMCIDAGMNAVLTKPIMRMELHNILLEYCPGISLHEPTLTKALDSPTFGDSNGSPDLENFQIENDQK